MVVLNNTFHKAKHLTTKYQCLGYMAEIIQFLERDNMVFQQQSLL